MKSPVLFLFKCKYIVIVETVIKEVVGGILHKYEA